MKYLLILSTLIAIPSLFAQKSETLRVGPEDIIVKGTVTVQATQPMFVGQEYEFTMMSNHSEFDLIIDSKNLKVVLDESSKNNTGGLIFKVTPIDTGMCNIILSLGKNEGRKASLVSRSFKAVNYPVPPVFIGASRSGETITQVNEHMELSCKYDPAYGIRESYPVKSWQAKLGDRSFSGTGSTLSEELIEALNHVSEEAVLILTVELSENKTGHKTSEAIYLVR